MTKADEAKVSGAASEAQVVSVLVVDDHALWRDGVRSLLQRTEFRIVGEASSATEALEQVRSLRPRLALLDIRLQGGDGLDVLQAIKRECPQTAVLMLTTYESAGYLARAVAGGAAGYLLKGIGREDLLRAMRAVVSGEKLLSQGELARCLSEAGRIDAAGAGEAEVPALSEREQVVLWLLAIGLSNRQIAGALSLAENTIKTYVDRILVKLGVSDRVQAAVWAARRGLAGDEE